YVPGIAIIIVLMDRFGSDVLDRIGTYFSAVWLVGFAGASFYRQHFHCPRCHKFFFRRFKLLEPYARNCVNCYLVFGALDPLTESSPSYCAFARSWWHFSFWS